MMESGVYEDRKIIYEGASDYARRFLYTIQNCDLDFAASPFAQPLPNAH